MKRLTLTFCTIMLVAFTIRVTAQSEADMKAWQAYMTPGEVHKLLGKFDGAWTGEVTHWMAPETPPEKSKSTCTNKMIMGGRYQETRFTGSIMGMPFEGTGTTGYDNAKKMFISTWIDNMGTGMMVMEGTWDEATKTINFKGKATDPLTGKDVPVRETFKFIDNDTQLMELFTVVNGKEMKSMEIKLTRNK